MFDDTMHYPNTSSTSGMWVSREFSYSLNICAPCGCGNESCFFTLEVSPSENSWKRREPFKPVYRSQIGKIAMIKELRTATSASLKEAKDFIDGCCWLSEDSGTGVKVYENGPIRLRVAVTSLGHFPPGNNWAISITPYN